MCPAGKSVIATIELNYQYWKSWFISQSYQSWQTEIFHLLRPLDFFSRFHFFVCFFHFRRPYEKKTKDIAGECNLFYHKTLSQLDAILICPCADDDGVCWVGNIIRVEQMLTWNEIKKVKRKQLELWNIFSESKSKAHESTKNVSVFVQLRN